MLFKDFWFHFIIAARLDTLDADNPTLLEYIRKNRIAPPPINSELTKAAAQDYSQGGQTAAIFNIIRNKVFICLPVFFCYLPCQYFADEWVFCRMWCLWWTFVLEHFLHWAPAELDWSHDWGGAHQFQISTGEKKKCDLGPSLPVLDHQTKNVRFSKCILCW